jgi:hypothetical protein
MLPEELTTFENIFYSDYSYYESKYFNEETFERQVTELFGCFPIEYIMPDVEAYVMKKVYLNALYQFIREQED